MQKILVAGEMTTNPFKQNTIAIVYDFDGTLSPNNMQDETILAAYGINADEFWSKATSLQKTEGYEKILSYLKLLLHYPPFDKKPLRKDDLSKLASNITLYPGMGDGFFRSLKDFMDTMPEVQEREINLEHYVISCGMKEILDGLPVIKNNCKKVYACEYAYDEHGRATFPKIIINDTYKTQFLYRISKNKLEMDQDVNDAMPEEDKRIPFCNMIYIGDSETDIPSMTVVQKNGGHAIAVFNKSKPIPQRTTELIKNKRTDHFAPADYRDNSLLMKIIKHTLKKIVYDINYKASAQMSLDWVRNEYQKDNRK